MRRYWGGVWAFIIVIALLVTPVFTWAESPKTTYDKATNAYIRGDYSTAYRLFSELAEQGDPTAQYNLGVIYNTGRGVPQDRKEALKWYRKAAEQGHPGAQNLLGYMYDNGQGVLQIYKEAVKWYRKAAEQGNPYGQANLAFSYFCGQGVPQDLVLAYMWVNLGSSNLTWEKHKAIVEIRDILAAQMTPAQIEEAQRLAREWKPGLQTNTAGGEVIVERPQLERETGTLVENPQLELETGTLVENPQLELETGTLVEKLEK